MSQTVVKSGVKETTELNVGSEVYDELEELVQDTLEQAQQRARANDRKTLQGYDL